MAGMDAEAVRRENAAVDSENEAVRIQFEAVKFRNKAVKWGLPHVRKNAADRFFKVSVEMP